MQDEKMYTYSIYLSAEREGKGEHTVSHCAKQLISGGWEEKTVIYDDDDDDGYDDHDDPSKKRSHGRGC